MDNATRNANDKISLRLSTFTSGRQTSQVAIAYYALRDLRTEYLKLMLFNHTEEHYATAGSISEDIEVIDELIDGLFNSLNDQLEVNFVIAANKTKQTETTNGDADLIEAQLIKKYTTHFNINTRK